MAASVNTVAFISSCLKDKREDKRIGPENIDPDKQKSPITLSLDAEDSITMLEDSAENSRSSFRDIKIGKTPLPSRRMPRLSGKKKVSLLFCLIVSCRIIFLMYCCLCWFLYGSFVKLVLRAGN